jgi:hypothetical protein
MTNHFATFKANPTWPLLLGRHCLPVESQPTPNQTVAGASNIIEQNTNSLLDTWGAVYERPRGWFHLATKRSYQQFGE